MDIRTLKLFQAHVWSLDNIFLFVKTCSRIAMLYGTIKFPLKFYMMVTSSDKFDIFPNQIIYRNYL